MGLKLCFVVLKTFRCGERSLNDVRGKQAVITEKASPTNEKPDYVADIPARAQ